MFSEHWPWAVLLCTMELWHSGILNQRGDWDNSFQKICPAGLHTSIFSGANGWNFWKGGWEKRLCQLCRMSCLLKREGCGHDWQSCWLLWTREAEWDRKVVQAMVLQTCSGIFWNWSQNWVHPTPPILSQVLHHIVGHLKQSTPGTHALSSGSYKTSSRLVTMLYSATCLDGWFHPKYPCSS